MATEETTTRPHLTPAAIERLPPGEYPDPGAPGLRLRVTEKGVRVFRWHVTSLHRVVTLGRWAKAPHPPGFLTLNEARKRLDDLKREHQAGRLEQAIAALRPPPPSQQPGEGAPLTVRDLAKAFMLHIEQRRRHPDPVRNILEKDVLPALGNRPVTAITAPDVRRVIEAVVGRGASTHAGKVMAVAKQLFRFGQGRGDLLANPAAPLDPGALGVINNSCSRYLSPEEIGQFWRALDAARGLTPTVRIALRLLLLLGVRSGELLAAEWSEVDFKAATWTIPVAHQKLTKKQEREARPFVVPLVPMAIEHLRQLEALAKSIGGSRFVLASFHNGGAALTEKSLNHAMRRLFVGPKAALKFEGERPTPHDLRRSVRTHLGETLGVPPHVAERCLNHSLGRIAKIYDRGDYLAERRAALEKWSAYIERLIAPGETTVAFLPAKGA